MIASCGLCLTREHKCSFIISISVLRGAAGLCQEVHDLLVGRKLRVLANVGHSRGVVLDAHAGVLVRGELLDVGRRDDLSASDLTQSLTIHSLTRMISAKREEASDEDGVAVLGSNLERGVSCLSVAAMDVALIGESLLHNVASELIGSVLVSGVHEI